MRHLSMVLAAVILMSPAAQVYSREGGDWVGRRVVTKFGTVLRVGRRIIDRENLTTRAHGYRYRDFRVYRVGKVDGARLWLEAEKFEVSGWVPATQVIPLDRAIDYYSSRINANPRRSSEYVARGHIWWELEEYDKAIADYTEAIRVDPKDELAYHSRGCVWRLKEDYDKAIADFTEAIRIDHRGLLSYDYRGLSWSSKGDYAKAVADFDQAIRIDPKYADAYEHRAWVWATCPIADYRDGRRAVESATRACELTRWTDAYAIATLAAAEAEVGSFDEAVKYEEKASGRYKGEEEREEGQKRLALYRAKEPYREE